MFDEADTTPGGQNALPAAGDIHAQWRKHAHPGDHNASTRHSEILYLYGAPAAHLKKNRTP